MGKITLLELAEKVLLETGIPMSASEIWKYAKDNEYDKLVKSNGKTPSATINTKMLINFRDDQNSKFERVSTRPAKYTIKGNSKYTTHLKKEDTIIMSNISFYNERDLHRVLAYFAYNYMNVYVKTIFHEKSKKKSQGMNQWLHPDLVGVYSPIEDWNKNVLELSNGLGGIPVKLYSFEVKKELNFANLRENFFQTVSNSSWANESYLVVSNIYEEAEFKDELSRLSISFGIGVIELDVINPDNSNILFPAVAKNQLDWNTINKLCEENKDFKDFLDHVNASIKSNKIYRSPYDKVEKIEDIEVYFRNKIKT